MDRHRTRALLPRRQPEERRWCDRPEAMCVLVTSPLTPSPVANRARSMTTSPLVSSSPGHPADRNPGRRTLAGYLKRGTNHSVRRPARRGEAAPRQGPGDGGLRPHILLVVGPRSQEFRRPSEGRRAGSSAVWSCSRVLPNPRFVLQQTGCSPQCVADIHQLLGERALTRDDGRVPQLVEFLLNSRQRRCDMGEIGLEAIVEADGWPPAVARRPRVTIRHIDEDRGRGPAARTIAVARHRSSSLRLDAGHRGPEQHRQVRDAHCTHGLVIASKPLRRSQSTTASPRQHKSLPPPP